ncbi:hypothetical protein ACFPRL_14200 [Pseudoclavibacter helvolus]
MADVPHLDALARVVASCGWWGVGGHGIHCIQGLSPRSSGRRISRLSEPAGRSRALIPRGNGPSAVRTCARAARPVRSGCAGTRRP